MKCHHAHVYLHVQTLSSPNIAKIPVFLCVYHVCSGVLYSENNLGNFQHFQGGTLAPNVQKYVNKQSVFRYNRNMMSDCQEQSFLIMINIVHIRNVWNKCFRKVKMLSDFEQMLCL